MKRQITYGIPLLLILVTIFLWGCTKTPKALSQSILLDVTEKDHMHFPYESYIKHSVLTSDPLNGEQTRLMELNEYSYPKVWQQGIAPVPNALLGNEVTRRSEIETYQESIKVQLEEIKANQKDRPRSVLFPVVARELNYLAEQESTIKRMIVYSDLQELSGLANLYSEKQLAQLKNQPDKIIEAWLEKYPLPALNNIEVYLVYQPKGIEDNNRFDIVSTLYRKLLEAKGAQVYIGANLITE